MWQKFSRQDSIGSVALGKTQFYVLFFFGLNECYVELNTNEAVEKLLLSGKLGSARAVFAHYVALGLIDEEIIQAK